MEGDTATCVVVEEVPSAKETYQEGPHKPEGPRGMALRPTHFLALPLNRLPSLAEKVVQIQQMLIDYNENLRSTCIDPASLHLTLGVMAIQSSEKIKYVGVGPHVNHEFYGLVETTELKIGIACATTLSQPL